MLRKLRYKIERSGVLSASGEHTLTLSRFKPEGKTKICQNITGLHENDYQLTQSYQKNEIAFLKQILPLGNLSLT